ncbi:MAG: flagellar motor switch protein FliG [Pseudomonadales bacterium]|nr:flagellar motor switch protein FliG [Pseudomonadales bacterium]
MSEAAFGSGEGESGLDSAAILMLTVGEEDAAAVLRFLNRREVQALGKAMASLTDIPADRIMRVVDGFLGEVSEQSGITMGSLDYIRRMLVGAVGEDKAQGVLDRIMGGSTAGLDKLKWMDPRTILEFLHTEHPQIQAIVLSYLEPDRAADVLSLIDDVEKRTDLVLRVAQLDSVSPTALQELNAEVEQQITTMMTSFSDLGGARVAAEIMNNVDSRMEEEIMDGIEKKNEFLREEIQDLMFVFDNLIEVDDRGIQMLLREVSSDVLILALKGCEEGLKSKIFDNMSARAADLLKDDLDAKGPVKLSDVEGAQREIIVIARRLADAGEIALGGAGGEEMI